MSNALEAMRANIHTSRQTAFAVERFISLEGHGLNVQFSLQEGADSRSLMMRILQNGGIIDVPHSHVGLIFQPSSHLNQMLIERVHNGLPRCRWKRLAQPPQHIVLRRDNFLE